MLAVLAWVQPDKKKGVTHVTPFLPAFAENPEHTPIQ